MEIAESRETQKKTIFIKFFEEKDRMPKRVELTPTQTVGQVLAEQGLQGYLMFKISTRIILAPREPLFLRVSSGEILGVVRDENPFLGDD